MMTLINYYNNIKYCHQLKLKLKFPRKKEPVTCNPNKKCRTSDWIMLMTWKPLRMKERAKGRIMTCYSLSSKFEVRKKLRNIGVSNDLMEMVHQDGKSILI